MASYDIICAIQTLANFYSLTIGGTTQQANAGKHAHLIRQAPGGQIRIDLLHDARQIVRIGIIRVLGHCP
jgi:hypothetical protein